MRIRFYLFLKVFLISVIAMAQEKTVTGMVTDQDGLPLPGASVIVKGTSNGTQTDFDGNYSINVANGSTLVFSYVGLKTTERVVGASSTINVTLEQDSQALEEVVVVAYGTAKKATFTGSASEVKSPELENIPVATFTDALQGNSSGLQVNSTSGDPGSGSAIRIRGIGSLSADSSPLYVIDGVIVNNGNVSELFDADSPTSLASSDVLSSLNPADIESVTVLKDAASTSIYGARAANGVVLITTKKGKKGTVRINFDTKYGLSSLPTDGYKLLNSAQYYRTYYDGYIASGFTSDEANQRTVAALSGNNPYNVANPINANGQLLPDARIITDTDWVDQVFGTGEIKEYNLSASGGTEKTSYFTSLGYLDQTGIIGGTDFERISTRINLETQLSDKVKIGTNTSLTYTNQNRASASTAGASAVRNALLYANAIPVYQMNPDGSIVLDDKGNKVYNFNNPVSLDFNPLYTVENDVYNTKTYRVLSGIFAEFDLDFITEGLKFRTDESIDFSSIDDFQFYNPFHGNGPSVNGRGYAIASWNSLWTASQKFIYDRTFGDHHFNVLAGFENSENRNRVITAHATQYAIYGDVVLPDLANAAQYEGASSTTDKWSILSYFGRVNYDWKDKYSVSASYRRDGSSRFGKNNRYGNFYSVAGSWRISGERFMENVQWVDNLKLRGSYGTSGNDRVGLYDYITNFSSWNYDGMPGNALFKPGNPDLSWEESATLNVGLDFKLFKNRLNGSAEYYSRETSQLLYETPISLVSGFSDVIKNSASVKNSGFEFSLDYRLINSENFKWDLAANYTINTNEILSLPTEQQINGTKIWEEGGSIYDFYLRKWAGVDPDNGDPLWYTDVVGADGQLETTNDYNTADRFNVGSALPDGYGGFQTTWSYKGWSLSANTYFSIGGKILDQVEADLLNDGNDLGYQLSAKQLNSWKTAGDITDVPRFIPNNANNSNGSLSTRYLYDATYAKLKSVTLSYAVDRDVLNKFGVNSLSVYVSGNNLLTWTKSDFEGFDPEVGLNGLTSYVTPNARTIVMGLKLGL
ncbi:TonB-dependent receptor [Zhouia spongiae]|uniref:TonB-dependent receptor n=1 Tax=Zhouia spongiae TaxID=2202721 RepID=A0ABY3YR42_9FLAO|nr:TonB-dependent receptor [Zhouia spongiae]UNZ00288.1 TonB-dependent receptor [Zhouia spongiae]